MATLLKRVGKDAQAPNSESIDDPQAWPEPMKLSAGIEHVEFPVDHFPPDLKAMVLAVADEIEVPVEVPGVLALGVISAALRGRLDVIANKGTQRESVCLYEAVVAESGDRKTDAFKRMFQPLERWARLYNEKNVDVVAASKAHTSSLISSLEVAKQAVKAGQRAMLKAKAEGVAGTEDLRKAMADVDTASKAVVEAQAALDADKPIYDVQMFTTDVTPEGLALLLSRQDGVMTIGSDEGAAFGNMAGRYSMGVPHLDVFTHGYNRGSMNVDRASKDPIELRDISLTMAVMAQPKVIEGLDQVPLMNGSGLLARFLWCVPPSRLGERTGDTVPVPEHVSEAFEQGVYTLAGTFQDLKEVAVVEFSEEADASRAEFYCEVEAMLKKEVGELSNEVLGIDGWGSKLMGKLVRIAAEFAAVRCGGVPDEVTLADWEHAKAFAPYFIVHGKSIARMMGVWSGGAGLSPLARSIAKHIVRRGYDRIEPSTYRYKNNIPSGLRFTVPKMKEACEELVGIGWLRWVLVPQSPGKSFYEVNPAVHEASEVTGPILVKDEVAA